jgi:hypothetical protein
MTTFKTHPDGIVNFTSRVKKSSSGLPERYKKMKSSISRMEHYTGATLNTL